MRLTLARHPITDILTGDSTRLDGTVLTVDIDELRSMLLEDIRLESVDIEIVRPGENCRMAPVFDIIEPRAKGDNSSPDFPGVLGDPLLAGLGTTHVLEGAAVTLLDGTAEGRKSPTRMVLDTSGPAAEHTHYATLNHVVIAPHAKAEVANHAAQNASRVAGFKTAVYLAKAAQEHEPTITETFDEIGPTEPGREGLPRVAFIGQVYSRQRAPEVDEQVVYGVNTEGMVPVLMHPDEWLDGAILPSYYASVGGAETYFYQNHTVITELYRRHKAGEINFVGTVATIAGSDNADRDRNCQIAANLVKWGLNADAAVLTKYGGGVPHADMAETARILEGSGISTAVMVSDMSRDRRVESALLFNFPEVDAIVYCGGNDTRYTVPPIERVIAGHPDVAEALAQSQVLGSASIVGVANQQGATHLKAGIY